jgi:purine-binding chemotaxis protein CheW
MNTTQSDKQSVKPVSLDWKEVHKRLESVRDRLSADWAPSAARAREILQARAKMLAQESATQELDGEYLEVIEFSLAYEKYGIETTFVREVYPLKELTALPGTPPFVRGIINVRGRIFSVLDLKKFFDLPEKGLTELNKVIVVHRGLMEFGILADEIAGVRRVKASSLQPAVPTITGIREEYLRGLTAERTVILNAEKLLQDKNIVVHQEIEGI